VLSPSTQPEVPLPVRVVVVPYGGEGGGEAGGGDSEALARLAPSFVSDAATS